MIKFTKGSQADFVVTLNEKSILVAPNYLFVFKSRQDSTEVAFVLLSTDNSGVVDRYDEFVIDVDTYFANSNTGVYSYKVYEQVSSSNTDTTGLNCVETGYMRLLPATVTSQIQYAGSADTIKVYNG